MAECIGYHERGADNTEGLGGAFVISLISGLIKTLCLAMVMAAVNISYSDNGTLVWIKENCP